MCPAILASVLSGSVAVSALPVTVLAAPLEPESPVILIDRGHNNYGYDASDQVIEQFFSQHGFTVREHRAGIDEAALDLVDLYYTSNALAPEIVDNWSIPAASAFTADEISILLAWIEGGGALLLAVEHMPFAGSYEYLATALGVELSNGFAVRASLLHDYTRDSIAGAGKLLFMRNDGSMADHPAINGNTPYGSIEHLATDTGMVFRLPADGTSLLTVGQDVISLEPRRSWEFSDETVRRHVAGWSQAGVMEYGAGRIAVLGDNFLVSAPAYLEAPYTEQAEDAERGAHNHQFTLNLCRWLLRQEAEPETAQGF